MMTSRVVPAIGVTIARRVPVMRLKSVDLPTLGRPTSTTDGGRLVTEIGGHGEILAVARTAARYVADLSVNTWRQQTVALGPAVSNWIRSGRRTRCGRYARLAA